MTWQWRTASGIQGVGIFSLYRSVRLDNVLVVCLCSFCLWKLALEPWTPEVPQTLIKWKLCWDLENGSEKKVHSKQKLVFLGTKRTSSFPSSTYISLKWQQNALHDASLFQACFCLTCPQVVWMEKEVTELTSKSTLAASIFNFFRTQA